MIKIKPLLATHQCQFSVSEKNKNFDRLFSLKDAEKINILKTITEKDCIDVTKNDNSRYADADIFVFIKSVILQKYGEEEKTQLYIKMYMVEPKDMDMVIVISFHEEGMFD